MFSKKDNPIYIEYSGHLARNARGFLKIMDRLSDKAGSLVQF